MATCGTNASGGSASWSAEAPTSSRCVGRLDERVLALLTQPHSRIESSATYLSAVTAVDSERPVTQHEAAQAHCSLWTTGLHRLWLLSPTGWEPGVHPPQNTRLIDVAATAGEDIPRLLTSGSLAQG